MTFGPLVNTLNRHAVRFQLPLPIGQFGVGGRETNVAGAMRAMGRDGAHRLAAFFGIKEQQHLIADAEEQVAIALLSENLQAEDLGIELPRGGEIADAEASFENAVDVFHDQAT